MCPPMGVEASILTWSQVKTGLDPGRFTIATVPKLLARSKPWADYHNASRPRTGDKEIHRLDVSEAALIEIVSEK
jgi:DNA primase